MIIKIKKIKIDSSKSVHFNMIHINPRAGLKCVNDPGNPGTLIFCQMRCPQASLGTLYCLTGHSDASCGS